MAHANVAECLSKLTVGALSSWVYQNKLCLLKQRNSGGNRAEKILFVDPKSSSIKSVHYEGCRQQLFLPFWRKTMFSFDTLDIGFELYRNSFTVKRRLFLLVHAPKIVQNNQKLLWFHVEGWNVAATLCFYDIFFSISIYFFKKNEVIISFFFFFQLSSDI